MNAESKDALSHLLIKERACFQDSVKIVSTLIHANAKGHGWWDSGDRNFGEQIALMHSELSEALEAWRKQIPESDHVEGMDAVVEELADTVIRIMDTCHKYDYDLGKAIIDKMLFNVSREYKHGGKLI